MAFNLCHPSFQASIHCDKPTVDGHEAANLLQHDPVKASRGFMTESFVRPPVTLVISFPFNVELQSIVIYSKVGCQSSAGYEIWTHSEKIHVKGYIERLPATRHIGFNEHNFMQVSKGLDLSKEHFVFENSSFHSREPYQDLRGMHCRHVPSEEVVAHRNLRFRGPVSLNLVSHVAIRIFMNKPGSTTAIRWMEIWGQPSHSCSVQMQRHLLSLHHRILTPAAPKALPAQATRLTAKNDGGAGNTRGAHANSRTPRDIPSEFLDPLICDIMALPVLLPSGNTVDQSTLDRHIAEEAKWGRPPNDPFTGVAFSDSNKPIPNAVLKSRIDAYLLKNRTTLTDVARTLGTNQTHGAVTVSRLVNRGSSGSSDVHVRADAAHSTGNTRIRPAIIKRNHSSTRDPVLECSSAAKRPCLLADRSSGSVTQRRAATGATHAERLKSSLDVDLSSALSALPSFLRPSGRADSGGYGIAPSRGADYAHSRVNHGCSACDGDVGGAPTCLYRLQCGHDVCRECLTRAKNPINELGTVFMCSVCKISSASNQVTKLHS